MGAAFKTMVIVSALSLAACLPELDPDTRREIHERYVKDEALAIEYAQKCRKTESMEACQAACDRAYSNMTSAVGLPVACKAAAMVGPTEQPQ